MPRPGVRCSATLTPYFRHKAQTNHFEWLCSTVVKRHTTISRSWASTIKSLAPPKRGSFCAVRVQFNESMHTMRRLNFGIKRFLRHSCFYEMLKTASSPESCGTKTIATEGFASRRDVETLERRPKAERQEAVARASPCMNFSKRDRLSGKEKARFQPRHPPRSSRVRSSFSYLQMNVLTATEHLRSDSMYAKQSVA